MKRYRFTLAAALVFGALLAWVLTQERGGLPEKGEIVRLPPRQISKLDITHGDTHLILEREAERWHLTEPVKGLADPDAVERMLDALVRLNPGQRENADLTNPDYGLQAPVLTVTFDTANGSTTTIKLGGQTAIGSEYFATVTGRPGLYLVDSSFKSALEKDADDLRDKQVVRLEKDEVCKLSLRRGDETIIAERTRVGDEDEWYLREPLAAPADRFAVEGIIDAIVDAKVAEFADTVEDLAAVGLDKPQAVVTLTTDAGEEAVLRVGKEIEQEVPKEYGDGTEMQRVVYVRTDSHPQPLLVYGQLLDQIGKDVLALRDKTILHFAKQDVATLKVQAKAAASFEANKNPDGEWILQAPAGAKAERSKIDDLLWDLEDLHAITFEEEHPQYQDLQEYGLALPEAVITLTIRGQRQPLNISFGKKPEGDTRYCVTSQSEQVYQVADEIVPTLPASLDELTAPSGELQPEPGAELPGMQY